MNHAGEAVRSRLRELARRYQVDTELMLTRWVNERFVSRLAASCYRDRLAVKGAMLFVIWEGDQLRATADIDLHGLDESHSGRMLPIVQEIVSTGTNELDGIEFLPEQARTQRLVGGRIAGDRVVMPVRLGTAAFRLKVDTGFGHPVEPGFERRWYSTLLPGYVPCEILCYPRETVIAEKLAVACEFGADNTRIRDYYDIWALSSRYWFRGHSLLRAIEATFARREAGSYLARTDGYWEAAFASSFASPRNERIWRNWVLNHALMMDAPPFRDVVDRVDAFAVPLLRAARDGRRSPGRWAPDRGWH